MARKPKKERTPTARTPAADEQRLQEARLIVLAGGHLLLERLQALRGLLHLDDFIFAMGDHANHSDPKECPARRASHLKMWRGLLPLKARPG